MISTRALGRLPAIADLRRIMKGLAALDAILSADWESRYYSFNAKWDVEGHGEMGSMRNGSGDELFVLFTPAGVAIKGFAHEMPMSPFGDARSCLIEQRGLMLYPGVLDGFPDALGSFLTESAFSMSETTFVIWRLADDSAWQRGKIAFPAGDDPDGSELLLSMLAGEPSEYVTFASEYFAKDVDAADVAHVLALRPLDEALVERLGSERSLAELAEDLEEIGYPRH